MSEHSSKTKRGIKWSVIDQVVRQLVTLLVSAILSRLLTPAEFGLLGMVFVAIGFLQVLKDIGLGSSIIQKQGITEEDKSTIFWVNAVMGLVLGLVLVIAAPWLASFFEEPQLTLLLRVMALNFLITSLAIVPDSLIMKAIDFKSYFIRNLGTVLLGGIVGIVMAYYGYGVWALIGQTIVTSITGLIISFRMVKWMPRFIFSFSLLKPHLKYSLPLLADSSINYWVRNIDNLLVGKVLGSASLGIYNRAYSLMLLPLRQISSTLSKVMFPSFSLIQDDKNLMWSQFSKMLSVVALVSFPIMILLGVYAKEVILIIFGDQWSEAVPIFQVLSGLGAAQSIATLAGPVYYATGKTALLFKVGLVSRPIMILGIIIGLYSGGLIGMVWGYVISSSIAMILEAYFVSKILNKSLKDYFKALFPEIIASLALLLLLIIAYKIKDSTNGIFTYSFIGFHFFSVVIALLFYIVILNKTQSIGFKIFKLKWYDRRKKISSFDA